MRIASLALLALVAAAPSAGSLWLTPDRGGVVRIETCGPALCGRIVGVSWKGGEMPPKDVNGQPQCEDLLLTGLMPEEDGRLHGHVRNPEDGRVYGAEVWLAGDGDMRLRGYLGLPILGNTQHWTHYAGTPPAQDCRFDPVR